MLNQETTLRRDCKNCPSGSASTRPVMAGMNVKAEIAIVDASRRVRKTGRNGAAVLARPTPIASICTLIKFLRFISGADCGTVNQRIAFAYSIRIPANKFISETITSLIFYTAVLRLTKLDIIFAKINIGNLIQLDVITLPP